MLMQHAQAVHITQHFCQMLRDRIPDLEDNVLGIRGKSEDGVLANKFVFAMSFNAVKVFFVDLQLIFKQISAVFCYV